MSPAEKKKYVRALGPVLDRVRTDISAIKFPDGSRWTTEPITTHAMERHVNGGPARGACPIKEGESVTMLAVLDMDSHKGETSWCEMLQVAADIRDGLAMWGMAAIPFRSSGGRGVHLLILWEMPQDAYSVRQAIFTAIEMCGYVNGAKGIIHKHIEVFPKQDEVGIGENGNQFILPLAGASVPLDLDLGIPLDREAIVGMHWPMSDPVPVRERPGREVRALAGSVQSLDKVRAALFAIRNDGESGSPDYDEWFKLCCAVHEATGGSDEGKEIFAEWSAQNSIFDEKFFEDRVWHYVKPADKRNVAITRGTLYARARANGWNAASPDGFGDLVHAADVPAAAAVTALPRTDVTAGVDGRDLPPFERKKDGSILATIGNLLLACRRADVCGWLIGRDTFRDELMVSVAGEPSWRPMIDEDFTRLRVWLEKNDFDPIGREMIRDAVHLAAQDNAFDSATLWLTHLPAWDGEPRVRRFMAEYAGAGDTPYTRAVGNYLWTALAGRVLQPGVKADMVPVLVGKQGVRKTSLVMAMVPNPVHYAEVSLDAKEDDLARKMRGRLVGEFGELTGMRKKEVEALKAFISRTHENWVPKFKELPTIYARRIVFIGTTNTEGFLTDDTGNRRWLPVQIETTCDPDALARDRLQLWAEAAVMFREHGVMWQAAEKLARGEVDAFVEVDPWTASITAWLRRVAQFNVSDLEFDASRGFTSHDVARMALGVEARNINRSTESRIGRVLADLDCPKERVRRDGGRFLVYQLPADFIAAVGGAF
jgi:hypothetical protein